MLYCDDLGASAAFATSVVSPQGRICTRSSVLARVPQKGRTDGTHITSRERVIRGSTIEPWKTFAGRRLCGAHGWAQSMCEATKLWKLGLNSVGG